MTPRVSIIITSYNYGRFLSAAIESALHQTYPDCEIIVVDDGSTDGSLEVAASYSVRLLKRQHEGLAKAMLAGVQEATGEYIVVLNSDDVLHPTYVEQTIATLDGRHSAFVYTGAYLFGPHVPVPGRGLRLRARPFSERRLLQANFIVAAALVPRHLVLKVQGYDATLPALEDWDFWIRIVKAGGHGIPLDLPLYYYRQHSKTSRNRRGRSRLANIRKEIRKKHQGNGNDPVSYYVRLVPLAAMTLLSFISPRAVHNLATRRLTTSVPGPVFEPVSKREASPSFPWLMESCCQEPTARKSSA